MINAVIELSKYILAINLILYAVSSFLLLPQKEENRKTWPFVIQDVFIFINHLTGSLVLLSVTRDVTYLFYPIFQMIAIFAFLVLMRALYPRSDRLILNHIAMLLSISFIMLTRLSFTRSIRQFAIVAASMIIALCIPAVCKYASWLWHGTWLYALLGILSLGAVLVVGSSVNGSKLSFSVLGFSFQPSEFIKIIYVLFLAACLAKSVHFWQIACSAVLAGMQVIILAASRDLGSALLFFTVYVAMVFIATAKKRYLFLGIVGAAAACVVAYQLFSHVRVRVAVWLDPWTDIDASGYQITQSLFAIGTGGWFGLGIGSGAPESIPYVEQDFIFSAICEECGVFYAIALIAICVNLFLELVQMAKACQEKFMRYAIYGFGIVYSTQLFLTIGGNTKFVPLTGITLPFISYGGSSVMASMIMLAVAQGFYHNRKLSFEQNQPQTQEVLPLPSFPMKWISGVVCIQFLAISIYLSHFVYYDSTQVINNTYNTKRQEILASWTIRGDILASDSSTVLATTNQKTQEREYPFGEVFSHVIGYADYGKMGVEQNANIYLVSSNISLADKLQDDMTEQKHMGNTVITTLDSQLQQAAYDALGVYNGAVIVTDPTTGKILAMVSKPDFDPNEITDIWEDIIQDEDSSVLVNRTTQGLYPPGSTFKILTALEYIRENPDTYSKYDFTCNGKFTKGDNTIRCYHSINHGGLDFITSFAKSCNSSFANIGLTLNKTSFSETLTSLFFGQKLPVDMITNASQAVVTQQDTDGTMIQTVIGQGSTQMTPLHLAMITSMIANQGNMQKPYLIERIEAADGSELKSYAPVSLGQLITTEEASILHEMMCAVVEEGTGTRLSGQSYKVAGKTGSAEYNSKSDSHAWFTGYSYDTQQPIQITVIMEDGGSGGEYAVPVAKRIFDQYYLN